MSNLEKKQLKAQLTNEISKRFRDRIKELEDSRNALRTKIAEMHQIHERLQGKYLELSQEFESLKEWNERLMEFMDMSLEDRKVYIENLKATERFNSHMELINKMFSIWI